MRRSSKIAIVLLLVSAMLLTGLSVFLFTATAADANEASLKTVTITYGTDEDKESFGYEVGTKQVGSTVTGTFAEVVANLSNLAPEVDTRYVLTLSSDITVDAPITITGNEHTEIWIDLAGHKITSTVDGPMVTANGTGAKIRFWGEFNEDGSYGSFTTTAPNASFVKIAEGSTDRVDVKYIDMSFNGNAEGTSLFIAEGGRLIVQHSSVTHTSGNKISMVDAKGASVDLKYTEFWGDKSGTLVSASSSEVYIEGGEMIGADIVVSDNTPSSIIVTGFSCEVDTAFRQGSAETTTYILGSAMEIYTAIASGSATRDNLVFYYGDGNMYVIGQDPSEYGVANSEYSSFSENGGVWTMEFTSTAKALTTVAVMGKVPETGLYATPNEALTATLNDVGIDMRAVEGTVVRITTLLNDYSSGKTGCTAVTYKGNEDVSVIVDFNGHNIDYTSSDVAGNCPFTVSFDMHFTLDGADVFGKVGSYSTACRYAKVVYARQSSNSGQINYHLVCNIKNFNVVASSLYHTSASGSPLFWLTAGYHFIDNVNITYTGTTTAEFAATSLPMVTFGHTPFKKGVAFVNGLSINSTSTLPVPVYGMKAMESWRIFANNYKTDGIELAVTANDAGSRFRLENSTIKSDDIVFSGAGKIDVYDCSITTATGVLTTGSVVPTFHYGTGKTVIYTNGNILTGNTSATGEYSIGEVSEGVYKLVSDSDAHSLSLPVVFSSGMMLQRNKVINIYGYCQDIGATVRVTIGDAVSEATVDENGKWSASFEPLDAARGVTVTIKQLGKGDENTPDIVYNDVNIGEIWVTSGQSNASLYSGHLEDIDEMALLSETLGIREFTSKGYCATPDAYGNGSWKNVTASVVREATDYAMSAVGYATVAKLAAELGYDVPVGLITIAQGSTKISTWMDYEHIAELSPFLAQYYLDETADDVLPSKAHGTNVVPTVLYNRHVYPLEGFTTAGVLWYQGCGDIPGKYYAKEYFYNLGYGDEYETLNVPFFGPEGSTYTEYFTALEEIFRRAFGNGSEDLPFYVMQLAPYSRSGDGPASGIHVYTFKYEQFDFCSKLENTYLVPTFVDGMAFTSQDIEASAFIHPARKSPVGYRTADMILANEYAIRAREVYSYPQPLSAVRNSDGTVTITFDTELKYFYGDKAEGFELTADGTTWVKATGVINGKTLTLAASGVSAAIGVRYGAGRTQVELRDGTVIEVAHAKDQYTLMSDENGKYYQVIDALTKKEYIIRVDSTDCIRTMNTGNITNESGIPLVLFSMDVEEG
ncbi:MAG: hypothetical protein IKC87_05550 [Clostridia bacterium]|nr:hypothetical protein [Clostridia bacterium]